jgi:hypothetical protein
MLRESVQQLLKYRGDHVDDEHPSRLARRYQESKTA